MVASEGEAAASGQVGATLLTVVSALHSISTKQQENSRKHEELQEKVLSEVQHLCSSLASKEKEKEQDL